MRTASQSDWEDRGIEAMGSWNSLRGFADDFCGYGIRIDSGGYADGDGRGDGEAYGLRTDHRVFALAEVDDR